MDCKHRWFDIKNIKRWVEHHASTYNVLSGSPGHYEYGKIVRCANCEQTKELWETEE